jgi:CrcB protein
MYIRAWSDVNLCANVRTLVCPRLASYDGLLYIGADGDGVPRQPPAGLMTPIAHHGVGQVGAMNGYLVVFLGAGIGGGLRHGVNVAALRLLGPGFPYGTITVNLAGSLIMGLLAGWFAHKVDPGQTWRLFLTTGILGGFTTFSAFSLDAALLLQRGQVGLVALYVVGSAVGAILGLFAGLWLIRAIA